MAVGDATSKPVGPVDTGVDTDVDTDLDTDGDLGTDLGEGDVDTDGDIGEGDITAEGSEDAAPAEGDGVVDAGDGAGEGDAGDDASARSTLGASYDSDVEDTSTTPKSTNTEDSTMTAPDRSSTLNYDELVQRAASGDPEAQKLLDQWSNQPPVAMEVDDTMSQMEDSSFGDGDQSKQDQLYQKAISQDVMLRMMEKKARQTASSLPKDSPIRQTLLQQADQFKATRQKLNQQTKSFEQRLQDGKAKQLTTGYNNLLQLKAQGKALTPEQQAKLKEYEQKFGSFKAGQADLYNSRLAKKADKVAKQELKDVENETRKDTRQTFKAKEKEAKKELEEKAKAEREAMEPKDEEVARAESAVRAKVGDERAEKNREVAAKRKAYVEWAREKKEEIDSGEPSGEAGMMYSVIYSAGLTSLGKGHMGMVGGLKFLGKKAREQMGDTDVSAVDGQADGSVGTEEVMKVTEESAQKILDATPGQDEFDKNRAALRDIIGFRDKPTSDADDQYDRVQRNGGMPVLRFLDPHSAARLQRTRGMDSSVV